jgi:hypothetical protein
MQIVFALAVAMAGVQAPAIDVPSIVAVALERVVPKAPLHPFGPLALGNRPLLLDTARTTKSFQAIDRAIAANYGRLDRQFVAVRSRDDVLRCDPVRKMECRFFDDGVYAAITSVEPDTVSDRYIVRLLVLWTGGVLVQGFEQAMVVGRHAGAGWKVDSLGTARVIN